MPHAALPLLEEDHEGVAKVPKGHHVPPSLGCALLLDLLEGEKHKEEAKDVTHKTRPETSIVVKPGQKVQFQKWRNVCILVKVMM